MTRQQEYDMHMETAEFLNGVEVTEHPAMAAIPPEWALVPTESDTIRDWAAREGRSFARN